MTDGTQESAPAGETRTKLYRPRLPRDLNEDDVITVLRPKAKIRYSGERYDAYRNGMTVKEYIALMSGEPWNRTLGQIWADLRWDTDPRRNLIHVGPEVVPVPPPPERPAPKSKTKKAEAAPATDSAPAPQTAA
jgi:hypothetical protein